MIRPAIVLLSGGLDSATSAAIALEQSFTVEALTFDYGQRHATEITAAKAVADTLGILRHTVIRIDPRIMSGSALTGQGPVPKNRTNSDMASGIPVTYVPARNTLFLAHALAYAETIGANDIFIGVNALDYSGYPDCRPEFIQAFEKMAALATKAGVEGSRLTIHTPLIALSKAQIIQRAIALGLDLSLTHSCYDPASDGRACGRCDSCHLRRKGFVEAGFPDPTRYVS